MKAQSGQTTLSCQITCKNNNHGYQKFFYPSHFHRSALKWIGFIGLTSGLGTTIAGLSMPEPKSDGSLSSSVATALILEPAHEVTKASTIGLGIVTIGASIPLLIVSDSKKQKIKLQLAKAKDRYRELQGL